MKITTSQFNLDSISSATEANRNFDVDLAVDVPVNRPSQTAEEKLTRQIFQAGNGKGLIKFCRDLSVILVRNHRDASRPSELRNKLTTSLMDTLECSEKQAVSLIELSLELIHSKVHGEYRRSELELSYLIAAAKGAVADVSAN